MEKISDRLKKAMELRDMKQADIIEKTGINKGALSSYLSGRYNPKQDNIYLLAKALNVSEAWLMGADVPMEKTYDISPKAKAMLEELADKKFKSQKIFDILAQLTDDELDELIDYTKYLISKRKPS